MGILQELTELVQAGVIDEPTAERIREHYRSRVPSGQNRVLVALAILGSLLIGSGIVLLFAHNWDDLSRATRTILAFVPLVVSQALVVFAKILRPESRTWVESTTVALAASIAIAISLVSQIYHLEGNLEDFIWTWLLLSLPLAYLLPSYATALIALALVTWLGAESNFRWQDGWLDFRHWIGLAALVPLVVRMTRRMPASNFTTILHWAMPFCLSMLLFTLENHDERWFLLAYMNLFALFLVVAETPQELAAKWQKGYRVAGTIGMLIIWYMSTFNDVLDIPSYKSFLSQNTVTAPEFLVAMITLAVLFGWQIIRIQKGTFRPEFSLLNTALFYPVVFFLGASTALGEGLANLIILGLGIAFIKRGSSQQHLGWLNAGMAVITLLMLMRFLDEEWSFVVRGVMFIAAGVGFFVANYLIIKKRQAHDEA